MQAATGLALALLAIAATAAPAAETPIPTPVACPGGFDLLPAGTPAIVELLDPVDTRNGAMGATLRLRLAEPLRLGERVVVPAGAPASGELVHSMAAVSGMAGELIVGARRIDTPGGGIRLASHLALSGRPSSTGAKILNKFLTNGHLTVKGSNVALPAGARLVAHLPIAARVPCPLAMPPLLPAPATPGPELRDPPLPAAVATVLQTPPPGQAHVVIFHTRGFGKVKVYENTVLLTAPRRGQYAVLALAPGRHFLVAHHTVNDLNAIELEAGGTYFFEASLDGDAARVLVNLAPSDAEAFAEALTGLEPVAGR